MQLIAKPLVQLGLVGSQLKNDQTTMDVHQKCLFSIELPVQHNQHDRISLPAQ